MSPVACSVGRNTATFNQEVTMTAPRMITLIRLGRAKVLTRTSSSGSLPEVDNPIERYA